MWCMRSRLTYLQLISTNDQQVGGDTHIEWRLLAAVRLLAAKYQSEVEGRSLEALGDWDKPLNRQNEVRV